MGITGGTEGGERRAEAGINGSFINGYIVVFMFVIATTFQETLQSHDKNTISYCHYALTCSIWVGLSDFLGLVWCWGLLGDWAWGLPRDLLGDFLGEERAQERGLRTMGLDSGRLLLEGMEGRQIDLEGES